MNTNPHIGYVCADRGIPVQGTKGGSTHVRELVNALASRGAAITMLAARLTDEGPRAAITAELAEVAPDRFIRGLRARVRLVAPGLRGETIANETVGLVQNHAMYQELRRRHAKRPFDVIYERYSLWSFAGLQFARAHGVPFLLEVNAPLRLEQARWRALNGPEVAAALERQLFQLADRILMPSAALRDYALAQGARASRVRVVPNAADPTRFHPRGRQPERDTFVIGFVGSLKPWHGVEDLVRAFVRLRRKHDSYRLVIVGDGPLRPELERTIRREGLSQVAQVTGTVDYEAVAAHLADMDVACAPYPRMANFYFSPLKLYEYMAAGLPIVASNTGQITEVLSHRRTALLHPPGSLQKLVAHIEELRLHPARRARLGRAARRLAVERFSWDRNAARVLSMITNLRRRVAEGRYAPQEESLI